MKKLFFILSCAPFILSIVCVSAQTINLVPFATGLTGAVDIKNAGDSRLFIVEQAGRIRIVDSAGIVYPVPFLNIQSKVGGGSTGSEQGLLGLAFHPDYKNNGYFFVDYTDLAGDTRISRFNVSANPDTADPASEINLLTIYQPYTNHNGGNLMFGPDGYLYINMGDGGAGGDPGNRAQNKDSLLGKILRIDVNNPNPPYYFSPATNPFYGATAGRDEIWAYGVRNPWRSGFDRITGDCWTADVGQNAWEEIDFQPANSPGGENYGWRCYEGNAPYNTSGCGPIANYVFPIAVYANSGTDCSVTGGYIYRGGKWADLFGYYFYEDYCSGKMRSIISDGSGGWIINNNVGTYLSFSYSSFGEDRYGELYLASLSNGTIYRITGTTCKPTAVITYNNTIPDTIYFCKGTPATLNAVFGDSLTYQWQLNGNTIPSAVLPVYSTDSAGNYTVLVTNTNSCTNISAAVVLVDTCTNSGIAGDIFFSTVEIFPNPSSGKFLIQVYNKHSAVNPVSQMPNGINKMDVKIYNLVGEKVFQSLHIAPQSLIDISFQPNGIYFFRLQTNEGIVNRKIILQK